MKKLFKEANNRTPNLGYSGFGDFQEEKDQLIKKFEDFLLVFRALMVLTAFFLGLVVVQTIIRYNFVEGEREDPQISSFVRTGVVALLLGVEMVGWREIRKGSRLTVPRGCEVLFGVAGVAIILLLMNDFIVVENSRLNYYGLGFVSFFLSTLLDFRPFFTVLLQLLTFALALASKSWDNDLLSSLVFSSFVLTVIFLNYYLSSSRLSSVENREAEIRQSNEKKKFYKSFLNLFPDGLAFIGQDLDLEYANKSFMSFMNSLSQHRDFIHKLKSLKNVNYEESEKGRRTLSLTQLGSINSQNQIYKDLGPKIIKREKFSKEPAKSLRSIKTLYKKLNTLKMKTNLTMTPKNRSPKLQFANSTHSFLQILKKETMREKHGQERLGERLLHTDHEEDFMESMIFGQVKKVEFSRRMPVQLPSIFLSNHRTLHDAIKTTLERMESFRHVKKDIHQFNSEFNSVLVFKTLFESKSLEIRIIPIFFKDEPKLILSLNDCTDLMTIELLKKTDEYKNILMSYVSHELRTPLSGILAMLESLKEKVLSEVKEQFIEPALSCGRNLLCLVNDILDFEQIRKGKMRLFDAEFPLKTCLEDALHIVRFQAEKKGLELLLKLDENIPILVATDANRLRQIVLNLLGNALKFTLKGSITIKASVYKSLESHVIQVIISLISLLNF